MPHPAHLLSLLLLLALGVLGYCIVDDYGISWDEAIQRHHGEVSMDYAYKKLGVDHEPLAPDFDLEDYKWSNYGMLYQLTGLALELRLDLSDNQYSYYRVRHLLGFGLYLLALPCFYLSLRLRWPERPWYPLLGSLLLVLSPRIFAHAFFNPKDHVLLVFYIIATYTLLRLLYRRSWPNLLLHALATALALNTRLPALAILGATVSLLLWDGLVHGRDRRLQLAMACAYPVLSLLLMIPFFPYLWADTLPRLWGALSEMSDFDWGGKNLLFGLTLPADDPPAYYIPLWILVTTPIVYLIAILTGLGATVGRLIKDVKARHRLWADYPALADLTQLGLSVGPVLVVILLNSTLYNGWRHMHFVYPALVFLGVAGVEYWRRRLPRVAPVVLALGMAVTAGYMVCGHPHQQVYFNEAIHGNPILARFDMDYWGVGFRDALTQLAEQIPEGEVHGVKCNSWPCQDNIRSLPSPLRERLRIAWHIDQADYYATNFATEYGRAAVRREGRFADPVVEIKPCGQLSIGIYRVNHSQ